MSHVSKAGVCNLALSRLGEVRIDSLDDGTVAAGLCDEHLPYARRKTLRRFPWSFATKTQLLSRATDPFVEWTYAHATPADMVRLLKPLDSRGMPLQFFRQEGTDILSNNEIVMLKYVHDLEDLTRWDDLSLDVLALELAVRIAVPLTGSTEKRQMMLSELENLVLTEARYIDSVEDSSAENNPLRDMVLTSEMARARWHRLGTHQRREYIPPEVETPPPVGQVPVVLSATVMGDGRTWVIVFDQPVTRGVGYLDGDFTARGPNGFLKYGSGSTTDTWTMISDTLTVSNDTPTLSFIGNTVSVQNADGTPLEPFSGQSVVNNSTQSSGVPVLLSASVAADGETWSLVFSEPVVRGTSYGNGDFHFATPSGVLQYAAGDGTSNWTMNGINLVEFGDTPTLNFGGDILSVLDLQGDYLREFSSFPVTNNVPDPVEYIRDADGNIIYDTDGNPIQAT